MAEKLANVPGAQNDVPPSSAKETAGKSTQAIATTAAAAGRRERNFRARLFGCRTIAGPPSHAERQWQTLPAPPASVAIERW